MNETYCRSLPLPLETHILLGILHWRPRPRFFHVKKKGGGVGKAREKGRHPQIFSLSLSFFIRPEGVIKRNGNLGKKGVNIFQPSYLNVSLI